MSRRSRQNRADGLNIHHVRPSSRGGGGRHNLVLLPVDFHAALHRIAGNLTKEETLQFLDIVLTPGEEWTYKKLHNLRESLKS